MYTPRVRKSGTEPDLVEESVQEFRGCPVPPPSCGPVHGTSTADLPIHVSARIVTRLSPILGRRGSGSTGGPGPRRWRFDPESWCPSALGRVKSRDDIGLRTPPRDGGGERTPQGDGLGDPDTSVYWCVTYRMSSLHERKSVRTPVFGP